MGCGLWVVGSKWGVCLLTVRRVNMRCGAVWCGDVARAHLVHSTHALSILLYVNLASQAPHKRPDAPSLHWSASFPPPHDELNSKEP